MKKNGVIPDCETNALLFQLALSNNSIEESNVFLKKIVQNGPTGATLIPVQKLEEFFEESLSRDNFDGLAYQITYLEMNNIDISGWTMQRFRSAVNFYLNHQFNLNKIFTFVRYYVHFVRSGLDKIGGANQGLS